MLFKGEQQAIEQVLKAGDEYGYGNMIAHLKKAWAEELMKELSCSAEYALKVADTDAYPLGSEVNLWVSDWKLKE